MRLPCFCRSDRRPGSAGRGATEQRSQSQPGTRRFDRRDRSASARGRPRPSGQGRGLALGFPTSSKLAGQGAWKPFVWGHRSHIGFAHLCKHGNEVATTNNCHVFRHSENQARESKCVLLGSKLVFFAGGFARGASPSKRGGGAPRQFRGGYQNNADRRYNQFRSCDCFCCTEWSVACHTVLKRFL